MAANGDDAFDPFNLDEPPAKTESGSNAVHPVLTDVLAENENANIIGRGQSSSSHEIIGNDTFDPFHIGDLCKEEKQQQQQQQQPSLPNDDNGENSNLALLNLPLEVSRKTRSNIVLPPKLRITLVQHEEVSSTALTGIDDTEGSSKISVEGTLRTLVQCSDALNNAPFSLEEMSSEVRNSSSSSSTVKVDVRPNRDLVKATAMRKNGAPYWVVHVPKKEIGFMPVVQYFATEKVEHMPILLERKVSVRGTTCRVAIQVRSKLSNQDNMRDFTIAVAVPERVDAASVEILRGDGAWDDLKRTVKWKLPELKKGESFMVSAQAKLWSGDDGREGEDIVFPVLLRCRSSRDQISSVGFRAIEVEGYPSRITITKTSSFRLLHRLM